MPFILQSDSNTQVNLEPEFDFKDSSTKIENQHRTRDGSLFKYFWDEYPRIKFTIRFINSAQTKQINEWWSNNTELEFYEEGTTDVSSVLITNKTKPVDQFIRPYTDKFQGRIELEGY